MLETIDTLEHSSDTAIYALDETSIRMESNNRASWSEVGAAPLLEKNGSHKGINIVGSTCIFNNHHTVNDVYSSDKSITSQEIKIHLEYLLQINPDKKVVVFLDNAKTHTSSAIQEFYLEKKSKLKLIFLPRYSPDMNPQENVWNYLKAKLFRPASRSSIYELISHVKVFFDELNSDVDRIHSLAYGRSFLV
ncbi:IS630 family transposase [Wukongibacter sp. M2B1]|uniref:IS630 family transposase n=1 Tax=Wukongibacter sp. M2B1 TaxID=3088895 RepID=UPI003D7ADC41